MRWRNVAAYQTRFMSNTARRLIAIVWSDRALKAFSVAYKTISLCSAVLATWCGLHNDAN